MSHFVTGRRQSLAHVRDKRCAGTADAGHARVNACQGQPAAGRRLHRPCNQLKTRGPTQGWRQTANRLDQGSVHSRRSTSLRGSSRLDCHVKLERPELGAPAAQNNPRRDARTSARVDRAFSGVGLGYASDVFGWDMSFFQASALRCQAHVVTGRRGLDHAPDCVAAVNGRSLTFSVAG